MREGVGFIARRKKRSLEPANTCVQVALRYQVAADIVVRVAQRVVNFNRFEAFVYRFVVALLEAIDPAQERASLCGRVGFD